jgi:hypothetical protein
MIETKPYVIYSTLMGGYDDVGVPRRIFDDVDYILFTDQEVKSSVWRCVPCQGYSCIEGSNQKFTNRRNGKAYKALPGLFMPNARVSVCIDMTHDVDVHPQVLEEEYLKDSDIALFVHERRACVYNEVRECIALGLDYKDTFDRQVEFYRQNNYPEDNGLWELPAIVRRNTPLMVQLGLRWMELISRFSSRDQISMPYALETLGIKPAILPGCVGRTRDNNKLIPYRRLHR